MRVKKTRKFLLAFAPLLTIVSGCAILPASSQHVKEGDTITADLAYAVASKYPDDVVIRQIAIEANEHLSKPSGIPLPNSDSIPWDLAGPFGGILAMGYGLLKRQEAVKKSRLAKELRDLDPEAARKRYDEVS